MFAVLRMKIVNLSSSLRLPTIMQGMGTPLGVFFSTVRRWKEEVGSKGLFYLHHHVHSPSPKGIEFGVAELAAPALFYTSATDMVLTVNGHVVDESPRDIRTFIRSHSYLKETASTLLSTSTKVVGPVGLVYVMQREFAATIPHDKNVTLIGTEDVTTCLVVILRHTGSGATALGHFDTAAHHEGIRMMVQRVQELSIGYPEGRIEATLIGAFSDPKGVSDEVIAGVLYAMHKNPSEIDLVTACVSEMNTTLRGGINFPIIYGVAVNVKTREIFSATFPEQGPEMALRHARIFTGEHAMLESYDPNLGLLRIGPFNYEPMRGVDLWLEQNDDFIRQHLSSSPEVEPPGFATQTRMALKHIQEHPFPLVTVFPDNKPHFYRKDESGSWVQVRY